MPRITEQKLSFIFPDTWQAIKYDDESFYRNKVNQCQDTKAVDILALSECELFLIEVKDFRNYRIENKQRIKTAALAIEVAQKVRDTLIGLHGAYRCQESRLTPFYNYVFTASKPMTEARYQRKFTAILFIEEDIIPAKYNSLQHFEELRKKMQMQLKFLQVRCHVFNKKTLPEKLGWEVIG